MNTRHLFKISGIILFIAIAGFFFATSDRAQDSAENTFQEQHTIVLSIEDGPSEKEMFISEDETMLSILKKLNAEDPALNLKTKEFEGLGTLVEEMYGLKNGVGNEYWQYTVNGIMPQIGADALVPETGDHVEWEFKASEF
ncbi:MAG: DUF4430 domain-containing protein [Candidatus Paceibacterota bacterium]